MGSKLHNDGNGRDRDRRIESGGGTEQSIPIFGKGGLYDERVKSFRNQNWPFVDPTTHSCTGEELAMAGFMCCGSCQNSEEQFGKCFACDLQIPANDFGAEIDPWYLHQERSPNCPYLRLGKKKFPRDYRFNDIYNILATKLLLAPALKLASIEKSMISKIKMIKSDYEEAEK